MPSLQTPSFYGRWRYLLSLVSLTALCACSKPLPVMTPEESKAIQTLTADMRTRCVGRYLVDLPQRFVLNPWSRTEFVIDLEEIKVTQIVPMSRARFETELEVFKAQMRGNMKPPKDPTVAFVQGQYIPRGTEAGLIVDRAKGDVDDRQMPPAFRQLEAIAWKAGYLLRAHIAAFNPKLSRSDHGNRQSDVPEKLELLQSVLERLRGRDDLEIPTEPGVCFANGFLMGPANASQHEWLEIYHHLDAAPDVYTDIRQISKLKQDTHLLERGDAIEPALKKAKGHTVRKGMAQAQIPGAQEWLRTGMHEFNQFLAQDFALEANSKSGKSSAPFFSLGLSNGFFIPKPVRPEDELEEAATRKPLPKATFSEAQVLALWDAIVPTLRPRPGAF
ncbi:T6SS immunity protein Tli4 family protein [Ideonella sp.]|jgi:hypothetical protein|uniref:T6SS immunity protein Tli4 family protein n=1 Tax=Ideonella sp. TaxID=1929293 RepID=UPI0037C15485